MAVFNTESGVEVEFGSGDVGFRAGLIKNWPASDKYEKRVVVEVHQLDGKYGPGSTIGGNQEEVLSKFLTLQNPPILMTFPADDSRSLDSIIKTLQKIREDLCPKNYWSMIYADRLGQPLEDCHMIYDDYTQAVDALKECSKSYKWPEGYVIIAKVDIKEDAVRKVGSKLFPNNKPKTYL